MSKADSYRPEGSGEGPGGAGIELSQGAVIEKCAAGLAVLSLDGGLKDVNAAFCELVGHTCDGLLESGFRLEALLLPAEVESYQHHLVALSRGDEDAYRQQLQIVRKDGVVLWVDLAVNLVRAKTGSPLGFVVTAVDITEQRQAEAAFREMSFRDHLTGLPNRRLLRDRLSLAVARAIRDERYVAVLFVDLDAFKPINDTMGHAAGDSLLKTVAQRLLSCLREYDTAARVGGDEFVILLTDLAGREDATHVAERIRTSVAAPFVTEADRRLEISASIGIALYPEHAETARDLLQASDEAMYRAKSLGGNRIVLSTRALPQTAIPTVVTDVTSGLVRLTWEATFASGNAFIDAEHRELFRQSNRLLDLSTRLEVRESDLRAALSRLLHSVEGHFRHEERILAQVGYSTLAAHAARHRELLGRAETLARGTCPPQMLVAEILKFVVAEMIHGHVVTEDRDFFPWFKGSAVA